MKHLSLAALLLAAVAILPVSVAAQTAPTDNPLAPFGDAATYAAGFAAAALLGGVKKWTHIADAKAWGAIKGYQPLVVGAVAFGLYPLVSKVTGITDLPAPEVFARAPTAALAGVLARELFTRLTRRRS